MNNHDRSPIAIPAHIQERIAARQRSSGGACYGVVPATSWEPSPVVAPLGGLAHHLNDYNQRFFVMLVGGTPLVFDEAAKDVVGQSMSFANFRQLYQNHKVGSDSVASEWLKYPLRRTLVGEIIHAPDKPQGTVGDDYNTYRGPIVTPLAGDCTAVQKHIYECLCGGDQNQFDYYVNFLAHMFQKPQERPGVAIIHQSIEGTGKSLITRLLSNIWGSKHSIVLDKQSQLTGDFNAHLCGAMFICIEETSTARNIAAGEQLKNLVTAETLTINPKGKPVFQVSHYGRVIMNTNHEWAITAGSDSRRWFVPDISEHRVGERSYFRKLASAISDERVQQAFLSYLLGLDLDSFDPTEIPQTKALRAQRGQTLSRLDMPLDWLRILLSNGFIEGRYGQTVDWESKQFEIPRSTLRDSYDSFVFRRRSAPNFDTAVKSLKQVISIIDGPQRRQGDRRCRTYVLPGLGTAVQEFETSTRIKV